jgi:UDP-N-acetylglucosamine--N-acetylmuramyl-(pentapeptide) pyrophosphoryl-undecaprenol N-acetylglucosamine transferase
MRGPRVIPIVIAAGGTGGHFFPAEALAMTLSGRGYRPVLMTDGRSAGRGSQAFAEGDRHVLPGAGIAGRGLTKGIKAVGALTAGTFAAGRILRGLNAGAIVGFGGYPSVPPVVAARLSRLKIPVILHEQNAVLGRANGLLAPRVTAVGCAFPTLLKAPPEVQARATVVGNPVRPEIRALATMPYEPPRDHGAIRILVTGGSQGARLLSELVPAAIAALPEALRYRLEVQQQTRPESLDGARRTYVDALVKAEVAPFFRDMAGRLAAAHLVIGRAGASTVSEIAVAGRPSILVPLKVALDDDQGQNARLLAETGAAEVAREDQLTQPALTSALAALLTNPARLSRMAAAARAAATPEAAERLADLVERTAR